MTKMKNSMLAALAALSLTCLCAAFPDVASTSGGGVLLPALLSDLEKEGIVTPEHHHVITADCVAAVADNSVDMIFFDAGRFGDAGIGAIDKKLKAGGIVAVTLSNDPSDAFRVPLNYRVVYIRRFGSAFVAMRKIDENDDGISRFSVGRRLMAVPEKKKEALSGLEDALLEPPASRRHRKHTPRYLPDLMGDSLVGYPRRVFVDVGPSGLAGGAGWFKRHYPMRDLEFEMIRVDVVGGAAAKEEGIAEWLAANVREEEYVVVKADAEVVEEMVKGEAIRLVDELFLECRHPWWSGGRRRAYWECLALYGKLRDEGVAVHQWWG